ncbi:MAG: YjbQ family protein [Firmicutes bacterium]|nr:YjbQ family protein [Bacillota bacterium]
MMKTIEIRTSCRSEFVPISHLVAEVVRQSGINSGVCVLSTAHTTAGLTINENSDPDVIRDLLYLLDRLVPWSDPNYKHYEGNTAAHLKASLMGAALSVIVDEGRLVLGRWQEIFLCEFDGPRSRRVHIQILPSESGAGEGRK